MEVPDLDECIRLMEQHAMLANIRHHSMVVAQVANLLVSGLQKNVKGQPLPDQALCICGALLHDIAKTPCLDGSCDHALEGAAICRAQGYLQVADIVEEHVILKNFVPENYQKGLFTAREIVYYADKRVRHNEIVSLDARLVYILKNYGNDDARLHRLIRDNFNQCVRLEEFLFTFLDFSPEQLAAQVEEQPGLIDNIN